MYGWSLYLWGLFNPMSCLDVDIIYYNYRYGNSKIHG